MRYNTNTNTNTKTKTKRKPTSPGAEEPVRAKAMEQIDARRRQLLVEELHESNTLAPSNNLIYILFGFLLHQQFTRLYGENGASVDAEMTEKEPEPKPAEPGTQVAVKEIKRKAEPAARSTGSSGNRSMVPAQPTCCCYLVCESFLLSPRFVSVLASLYYAFIEMSLFQMHPAALLLRTIFIFKFIARAHGFNIRLMRNRAHVICFSV